ncbi:MAG TPA: ATP-binding protein [Burkholderiales bacterium]|nr:ATP-binding protein [Burkholderiales bacterium]
MSRIHVLVAATLPDLLAEGISAAVAARSDMALVEDRVVEMASVGALLASIPANEPRALVLVGPDADTEEPAARWLADRPDLVLLRVDRVDGAVHLALRDVDPPLDSLLTALRGLAERAPGAPRDRVAHFRLRPVSAPAVAEVPAASEAPRERSLLDAAMNWIHAVLRDALARHGAGQGDLPGLTVSFATVEDSLAHPAGAAAEPAADVKAADAALAQALAAAEAAREPLAMASRVFGLSSLEFRLLLLALAPELDPRYQRCIGLLLDDLGRRVGTLGLYAALLGEPSRVRRELAHSGSFARWHLLDGRAAGWPPADEPLRLDPYLCSWLLGDCDALGHDPRVRRALRPLRWPGASLLDLELDRVRAASLVSKLQPAGEVQWLLFAGEDAPGWRALLELGAELRRSPPLRVDAGRLTGLDVCEVEDSCLRLGRMSRLCARPLILDVTGVDATQQDDDALRLLLAAIGATGTRSGVICRDAPRIVRLLGSAAFALTQGAALHAAGRAAAVRAAAKALEVPLTEETARALAHQYPMQTDGIEQAMRIARSAKLPGDSAERRFERFVAACKDVAAEGVSRFADRIDSVFELDDVVLPPDRRQQLEEIVASVRLSSKVLDEWKFRDQLPYGRGTTALFHGPSGCGKTMSALAVAKALGVGNGRKSGVPVLRIELSRLVSKYIGDTPKNIDQVFADAKRSGAAILIDEADALLSRRSAEPKDANDRHSAMEIAYLLQKLEGLHDDGLVILTTNLRQNIDPAFLRRLRYIVDFPRPDAEAREKIWRRCLPEGSHSLDDAAFRQLARKIDLTGGNIRQITLRAAFAAAAAGSRIRLEHVAYASRAEFAKLGVPAVALDVPGELRAA